MSANSRNCEAFMGAAVHACAPSSEQQAVGHFTHQSRTTAMARPMKLHFPCQALVIAVVLGLHVGSVRKRLTFVRDTLSSS